MFSNGYVPFFSVSNTMNGRGYTIKVSCDKFYTAASADSAAPHAAYLASDVSSSTSQLASIVR